MPGIDSVVVEVEVECDQILSQLHDSNCFSSAET